MQSRHPISYRFTFPDGATREFRVVLDGRTLADTAPIPEPSPRWAALEYQQCPGCALSMTAGAVCPAAARVADLVAAFARTLSYESATVEVTTPERTYSKAVTVQAGVSSLLGLKMAASGCPTLAALRPMARFHLPFATELETVYRAASMYLVGQWLRAQDGEQPDASLDGLARAYRAITEVNRAFARRLTGGGRMDANVNALVLLDLFAKALPDSIEFGLEELRPLFAAWGGA